MLAPRPRTAAPRLFLLLLASAILASGSLRATEILPLDQVKAGMKGYGLSVFRGQTVERFDVEVIGVVANMAPSRSMIVVKVSGQDLENAGIVAGMSGSPVYVDGRLMGAVASGWGFAKAAIGGVTPIEEMLRIEMEGDPAPAGRPGSRGGGSRSLAEAVDLLTSRSLPPGEFADRLRAEVVQRYAFPSEARSRGLVAPLVSGFSASTLDTLGDLFPFDRSLALPVSAGVPGPAAGGPAGRGVIEPGASIAALLVSGDLNLGATGTVSYVYPDGRFLAFGHPFLGFGDLELPVAPSFVVSVLPNLFQSFKIASPGKGQFRLRRDRDTGISGGPGLGTATVPLVVRFVPESGAAREIKVEISSHPKLLPPLTALVVDTSLNGLDGSPRDRTSSFDIRVESQSGTFRYADQFAGIRTREVIALTSALLTGAVADNEFQDPGLRSISVEVRSRPGENRSRLIDASLGVRKVHPGDRVPVSFRTLGRRDEEKTHSVILEIPRETPEGRAAILIADGSSASALRLAANPAEPRSLDDFRRMLGLLSPTNEAVVVLTVPSKGIATGSRVVSSLPPSAASLVYSARNSGEAGTSEVETRILSESVTRLPAPVTGNIRIDIEIESPKN